MDEQGVIFNYIIIHSILLSDSRVSLSILLNNSYPIPLDNEGTGTLVFQQLTFMEMMAYAYDPRLA
jgi:hypothetical protein